MTDSYNDGKWHGWNGGECPVHPNSEGDFAFLGGWVISGQPAGAWDWNNSETPIIAFRITEEYKEPREVYLARGEMCCKGGTRWIEVDPEVSPYATKFREVLD